MITQQGDKKLLASPCHTLREYKVKLDTTPKPADRD